MSFSHFQDAARSVPASGILQDHSSWVTEPATKSFSAPSRPSSQITKAPTAVIHGFGADQVVRYEVQNSTPERERSRLERLQWVKYIGPLPTQPMRRVSATLARDASPTDEIASKWAGAAEIPLPLEPRSDERPLSPGVAYLPVNEGSHRRKHRLDNFEPLSRAELIAAFPTLSIHPDFDIHRGHYLFSSPRRKENQYSHESPVVITPAQTPRLYCNWRRNQYKQPGVLPRSICPPESWLRKHPELPGKTGPIL